MMPEPGHGTHPGDLAQQARRLLSRYLHVRRFPAGSLLWREGETSGLLVAIRTGRVKIYRLLPNGRAVTLLLFGPDDVFGFLPFLDGRPYPAYAQAIDDVEAEVMPRSALLQVLRAEPDLAATLIALLGERLRAAFDLIQEKGAALGTVLAFMMSVIGLSLPETIILRKVLTVPLIATFVGVVAAGILVVGYVFNLVL